MIEFLRGLFSGESFMPHGHCYLWRPEILWLHVLSDAVIGLAYASIPFALVYIVRKRKDLAFNWVFILFGVFILACGATHVVNIWTVWDPVYRLSGVVKAVTAFASIGTAIALWPLVPKILVLPSPAQLAEANRGLHLEIVERKRAEEALEERNRALVEAERLKGEFVANVSHELRTPLTLIVAPLESMLSSDADRSESDRRTLATVHNNAVRLLQMVNGLLDFSKLEANKVEVNREPLDPVQLTRAIAADFEPVMAGKELLLALDMDETGRVCLVDRYLYERILFNLLSNAVKFTEPGGRITVRLRVGEGRLRLAVQDTGVGIAADHQALLFEMFRQLEGSATRRFEGTGLGLALVKQFSELLGGTVSVDSALGEGSTFTVEIDAPATEDAAAAETARTTRPAMNVRRDASALEGSALDGAAFAAPEDTAGRKLPRVVIAEDNDELASYIATTLREVCRPERAVDGAEALDRIKQSPPDLVLSDVMMPRMDGLELCRRIKGDATTAMVPVVLLTALTHREALIRGWEAGATEYLFKPFHPTELLARVRSLLELARAERAAEEQRVALAAELAARHAAEANVARLERIEAELRRTNRVKDEFLAILSHELRTPMNAILGWSQLLEGGDVDPAQTQGAYDALVRNAHAQMRIIDDLLDVSRIITGKLELKVEPVRIVAVVDEAVRSIRLAADAKNIALEVDLDESLGPVAGDADRLRQVVWNLLTNAIRFTEKGGRVKVTVGKEGSDVVITVADSGVGIEPDFLPHVFERFLQENTTTARRFGGLGLGLSIVRHLVELHGGTVRAASEGKGRGATFVVTLPPMSVRGLRAGAADADGDADGEKKTVRSERLKGRRILVVDDEADARGLIATILRLAGAEVAEAGTVQDAVRILAEGTVELVVSDISMPGEDGFALLGRIRAGETRAPARIPIVALTAHAREEDRDRSLSAGFQVHLDKPVDPTRLVEAVERILEA